MATYYVDSAASGLNNGTSWVNAWASLGSSTGVNAGDEVLVDDGHSDPYGTNTTWSWLNGTADNPVRIRCVDKATGLPSTGALIAATANVQLSLVGGTWMYGLSFLIADQLTLAGVSTANRQEFERCTFTLHTTGNNRRIFVNSSSTNGVHVAFRDCLMDFIANAVSGTCIGVQCYGLAEFIRCDIRVGSAANMIFLPSSRNHYLYVEGCDLSQSTETVLLSSTIANTTMHFNRCRLPSGWTYSGPPSSNSLLIVERCAEGSLSTAPFGLNLHATREGILQSTTSAFRTGGADDGQQGFPHSWQMAGNAQALAFYRPMRGPKITRWVPAGSPITVTVYVASSVTLNDDEFWIDIAGPSGVSPAYAHEINVTKRCNVGATPQPLASDASSWSGAGTGTKQKITHTWTPAVAGPVTIRPYLARNTTVYVDPLIEVSGLSSPARSWYVDGVQFADEPGAGGGSTYVFNVEG